MTLFFCRFRKGRWKWKPKKAFVLRYPFSSNAEGMQKSRFLISCYSCLEEYKSESWSLLHSACSLRISACTGMTGINLALQHQDTSLNLPVLVPDFHYTAKPALSRNSAETSFSRTVRRISEVWGGRKRGQLLCFRVCVRTLPILELWRFIRNIISLTAGYKFSC